MEISEMFKKLKTAKKADDGKKKKKGSLKSPGGQGASSKIKFNAKIIGRHIQI